MSNSSVLRATETTVRLDCLKSFPRQSELFGELSAPELRALATSIDEEGQLNPIHIMADGTILSGHQRVRAIRLLGRDKVRAIIRHDLEGKPADAERFFIEENLLRRHLSMLGLARLYSELKCNARRAESSETIDRTARLRDILSAQLASMGKHVSGRSLDRYLRLLKLPRPIQDAIEANRISMRDGAALLWWPPNMLDLIVAACKAGKGRAELTHMIDASRCHRRPDVVLKFSAAITAINALLSDPRARRAINNRYSSTRDSWSRRVDDAIRALLKIRTKPHEKRRCQIKHRRGANLSRANKRRRRGV